MFKQQEKNEVFKEVETIIGPSIKVKGNFNGQGNIVVEGAMEGSLKTAGNVFVGDKAKIVANIEANDIRMGGKIEGNIIAKGELMVGSSAKIDGDIECESLIVEHGATINGKCLMLKKSEKENTVKEK